MELDSVGKEMLAILLKHNKPMLAEQVVFLIDSVLKKAVQESAMTWDDMVYAAFADKLKALALAEINKLK